MVYRGGLFQKIVPFIKVVFTGSRFSDYGYRGAYEQGVFEGWAVNTASFFMLSAVIWLAAKARKR
jgi:hypothetical protein